MIHDTLLSESPVTLVYASCHINIILITIFTSFHRCVYDYNYNYNAGGEKWFVDSGVEERLDLPMHESVSQFINEIGRDYLVQSHSYLMFNLEQGCLPIQYERLRVDFNNTMLTVFDYWNVLTEVQPRLLALLQSENPRQLRAEKGSKGGGVPQHVTSSKHSSLFISYVNGAIDSHDRGSVKALIAIQAEELHYENRQQ